jgi:phenylpropionate dioxygenase-like ring-hydroxylating dioxygenase large terminal subunit
MREVERYTSPSRLAAEKRVLFQRLPIVVGRESDLPEPGRFFTHDAAGVALLMTRDEAGKVHAMLNVCRHRGTRLVYEEEGSAQSFVCKYHSWKYDLCGQLARPGRVVLPPALEQFMDDSALVDFPCETRHGFVWVLPTARAELDVARWLGDLDGTLAAAGLEGHVVFRRSTVTRAASWKLVMEALLAGRPSDEPRDERRHLIFPSSLLVLRPETVSHVALFPRELGEVTFVHTLLARCAPETVAERDALEETWARIDGRVFGEEDLAAAERLQSELGADEPAEAAPALEGSVRSFHEAIDRALAAHPRPRE